MHDVEYNPYNQVILQLDEMQNKIANTRLEILNIESIKLGYSESTLDTYDLAVVFIAGIIGGVFSSSRQVENLFQNIHDGSSVKNPKGILEKILHHAGDEIDKGGSFITRNGDRPAFGFHRLFFGHDILSLNDDNPLLLMIGQYGFLKGPIQLMRHLIADTFSKQGLPMPGHSFLDYIKDNGQTSNYLVELTKKLSEGTNVNSVEAFNHLFSIRMSDAISQGLTWAIISAYIKYRGIEDKIKVSQMKLSAYSISFFTNAIAGMKRTGGLPYINWITFGMMAKEFYTFIKANYNEIKILEEKTACIVQNNIELEKRVLATGSNIKTYNNSEEFITDIEKTSHSFDSMTNFFEEE